MEENKRVRGKGDAGRCTKQRERVRGKGDAGRCTKQRSKKKYARKRKSRKNKSQKQIILMFLEDSVNNVDVW